MNHSTKVQFRKVFALACLPIAMLLRAPADAASAPRASAASVIVNRAEASFTQGGKDQQIGSNDASTRVDEELGIQLAWRNAAITVQPGIVSAVPFVLTNAGNGSEAFTVDARLRAIDGKIAGLAIDRDGDGRYDASIDTAFTVGAATPALAAGAKLALLVLVQVDRPDQAGTLDIAGAAVTGSGTPGTTFAGRGDGGGDAIVGPTTAAATLSASLASGADQTSVTLEKSQKVEAPDGSDRPVHGALVVYTIDAHIAGTGAARGATIADPIPDGTDYVPGSLSLDGTKLSDAPDGDAGTITTAGVEVALGDVTAPATRTLSFTVKIR